MFGNHENMTWSVNRFHRGTVRVTLDPVDQGDGRAELYVFHVDGSHGWEHTVNGGETWIPRENPVFEHPFHSHAVVLRILRSLQEHPRYGMLAAHSVG